MFAYPGARCDEREKPLELGTLSREELSVLDMLIGQRRSLPICLGSAWRCYACGVERSSIRAMAKHVLEAHEPEPFNEEDWTELLPGRPVRV